VLEYLNSQDEFKGKVVAFTSWDVFPYILNEERSQVMVNSGYEQLGEKSGSEHIALINKVQSEAVYDKKSTRYDQLTFLAAREYVQQHQPKVVFIGLGETDDFAHDGRYDLYLRQAHKVDGMVEELWHWVQTTAGYKDNTTLLITTDHGRGKNDNSWTSHGSFTPGSSETWLAMIGPGLQPLGEKKDDQQLYQKQIAKLIAELVGEKYQPQIVQR
jgi:arylsulfatase A-like enzyme